MHLICWWRISVPTNTKISDIGDRDFGRNLDQTTPDGRMVDIIVGNYIYFLQFIDAAS